MKVAVIGGSREADILIDSLRDMGFEIDPNANTIVIAAHPFDTDLIECALISAQGKKAVLLQRPKWQATQDDTWLIAKTASHAAKILASLKVRRALLAVGNSRLAPFYRLENVELFVRSRNTPHPPTPPRGGICPIRGPFDLSSEVSGLIDKKIDVLVVHNAGGQGGWPKIAAARQLGLTVVLIDRPKPPEIETVTTVKAALDWVAATYGLDLLG